MFRIRFSMRGPTEGLSQAEEAAARTALYRAAIDMTAWGEEHGCVAAIILMWPM